MPQTFQPLTPQQYQSARSAGFSADQIVQNEQKRKAQTTGAPAAISAPSESFGQKAVDVAAGVTNFITGNPISKAITSLAAVPVQLLAKGLGQKDPYAGGIGASSGALKAPTVTSSDQPLGSYAAEEAGNALTAGSLFFPASKVAGGVSAGLKPLLGETASKIAGTVASGAAGGYGFDVGGNLSEGKTGAEAFKPGLTTALGGALPLVPPIVGAAARGVGESLGVSTGTGYGVIKEALNASSQGGARGKAFTDALRGNTSPEALVEEGKSSLSKIIQDRTQTYQKQLEAISGNTKSYDTSSIIDALKTNLDKFKVGITKTGKLDFGQSAIRFDKGAQGEIQTIVDELKGFGTKTGDRTAIGIDSLKRAFGDLYSQSSNVRAFTAGMTDAVRGVLKDVPGYDKLSSNYAEKTGLIKDIQRGLSLNNKAGTDTAFKKLNSALRTNNEFRKELIAELDKASGGYLSSKIAGQQLSEALPRGIARQIEGFGAVGGAMTFGILPILKVAAFASPRVVGELVNALGISRRVFNGLLDRLGAGAAFPGDTAINGLRAPKGSAPIGTIAAGGALAGAATLAALPSNISTSNEQQVEQEKPIEIPGRNVTVTQDDLKELRDTLFAEISNRPLDKQLLEARTIINTALNRIPQYDSHGTPKSLTDVLSDVGANGKPQYQGFGTKEYKRAKNGMTTQADQRKLQAIDQVIQELVSGKLKDNTENSVFYSHNPDGSITYRPGSLFK